MGLEDDRNAFEWYKTRHCVELPGMMVVGVQLIDEVVLKTLIAFLKESGYFLTVTN